jgi:hypothetical protein
MMMNTMHPIEDIMLSEISFFFNYFYMYKTNHDDLYADNYFHRYQCHLFVR